ncbi:MAG: hypothetical protein LBJ00_17435 [Planctomycetaceae bacterium]|nr:hypothetical protein [Planctomycetaceae bacterium]
MKRLFKGEAYRLTGYGIYPHWLLYITDYRKVSQEQISPNFTQRNHSQFIFCLLTS